MRKPVQFALVSMMFILQVHMNELFAQTTRKNKNAVQPQPAPAATLQTAKDVRGVSALIFSKITGASVQGIEVTQTIESMSATDAAQNQLVPLLAGRKTFARVYTNITSTEGYGMINGEITITTSGNQSYVVPALQSISLLDSWNDSLIFKRNWFPTSLTFPIPAALVAQDTIISIKVTKLTDSYNGGALIPCSNCSTQVTTDTFAQSAPLRLVVIGLRYSKNGNSYEPRQLDFDLIGSWLPRAYPIASLSYNYRTVDSDNPADFNCGQANTQVAAIRALDVANGTDARTHYYGLVYDGGFFMRGCAAVPGVPNPAAIGSGPTGSSTFGWDNDGSYGDWYTGHELGHTLGRSHVGGVCGETGIDPNYPFPNAQLSGPNQLYTGFDAGDVSHGIPMQACPGIQWHDVMSYCSYQWLSSYTYNAISTRLIAENAMAPGAPLAGAAMKQQYFAVTGLVDFGSGSGEISSVHTVDRITNTERAVTGQYHLKLYNSQGKRIDSIPVKVTKLVSEEVDINKGLFHVNVKYNENVARIELWQDKKLMHTRSSTTSRAILTAGVTPKASISVEKANAGSWTVKWQTPDYKNAAVTFSVLISPDNGYSWLTVATSKKGSSYTIDGKVLKNYRSLTVKVIMNDGIHSSTMQSNMISL